MPKYTFYCQPCNNKFDELCYYREREEIKCNKCGGPTQQEMATIAAIIFKNPKGTSKEDNLEYVMRYNLERASLERMHNEKLSDDKPYKQFDDSQYEGRIADVDPFQKGS